MSAADVCSDPDFRFMTRPSVFVFAFAIVATGHLRAQVGGGTGFCPTGGGPEYDRPVSWRELVPNFLCDQKAIWTFPTKLGEDHVWVPTVAVVGVTGALFAADPYEAPAFRNTKFFSDFNKAFPSTGTEIATIIAPVSLYAAGLVRRDSKMQHTALLAGEAVADAEVLTTVFKDLDRRRRPINTPKNESYWDSWFDAGGSRLSSHGSFPSGHTIAAVAIATVVAHRYREHRWVPYVAYGLAGVVGFSRLTLSAHYMSDVFAGAAFGYSISRFAVLRY